jgi:hypothetical protein
MVAYVVYFYAIIYESAACMIGMTGWIVDTYGSTEKMCGVVGAARHAGQAKMPACAM